VVGEVVFEVPKAVSPEWSRYLVEREEKLVQVHQDV
jgi:hypothetical protein